jgi:hypothetical protein
MIAGYGVIVGLTRSLQRLKTSNTQRRTPNAEVGMRLRQAPLQPRVLRG